ncbi:MAG: alpha/beta hydrolase [Bacteroidia bacterium]|nr:alpha/beta hydrolase [Bacteroidia bacterium]
MTEKALPTLFFAHANGFPAACYEPFFEELAPYPLDYVPILGKDLHPPRSWDQLADEVIAAIEDRHTNPVVGIGHSFGGVAIFLAARRRPELFSQIMVLDPPLFSWRRRLLLIPFQLLGLAERMIPPARKALARREHFSSREEAKQYWATKHFFQAFTPESLDAYVEHGLRETADGFTLTVPGKQEAQFFAAMTTRIGKTTMAMPAHYLLPTGRGILPSSHHAELRRKFSSWQWHELPGNHMFPLEHPQETAALVKRLIV